MLIFLKFKNKLFNLLLKNKKKNAFLTVLPVPLSPKPSVPGAVAFETELIVSFELILIPEKKPFCMNMIKVTVAIGAKKADHNLVDWRR